LGAYQLLGKYVKLGRVELGAAVEASDADVVDWKLDTGRVSLLWVVDENIGFPCAAWGEATAATGAAVVGVAIITLSVFSVGCSKGLGCCPPCCPPSPWGRGTACT